MDTRNYQIEFINLLENAANTTAEGITISTLSEEDMPLIYVNEGFERLTGYSKQEVIGKNCRFLQGRETEATSVEEIRKAIRNGTECTVELLNYKKNGEPFWNRLSITPLKDNNGNITHFVGIQSDITELQETKKRLERANNKLASFHRKITKELEQATKAQRFILPASLPENKKIKFSSLYRPMDQIGGDFYDVTEFDKGVYGVLVADVTGHGIPAALLTFMTSLAFKNSIQNINSTELAVSITNKKLLNKMPKGAFVTMFYAIYDSTSKILTYTQAGHPHGIIIRPTSKEIIPLTTKGGLVGVFPENKITYGESKIRLQKGDKLLLYSDALIEARNKHNQMINSTHLTDFLIAYRESSISELLEMIYRFGLNFSGKSSYQDDFTLLGFEVLS